MIIETLTLDTSAYAAGDLLADTQEIQGFSAMAANALAYLTSVTVIDEDDQKAGMDIVFLNSNVTLGTENSAPSISDANARTIMGIVRVNAGDYVDLGGVSVATRTALGLPLIMTAGTPGMWFGCVTLGTPTHTASGVRIRFGFVKA